MSDDFTRSVLHGLKLSKRVYFGKEHTVSAPPKLAAMEKASESLLPTAPMVYAVISDPEIVDNPDIPSYQPHVHGRCDPPALIPLHMNEIAMELECYVDTVLVTVTGKWKVHCVAGSGSCSCRIAIPMGEEGSILGVDVDVTRRSYSTQLAITEENADTITEAKARDGGFLRPNIFVLTVPQVDGGDNLSIKVRWSQKLLYSGDQFSISVPFSFPEFVNPAGKLVSREKIRLNVNSGTAMELICKKTSHQLKEIRCQVGHLSFSYEADVKTWSKTDFTFSYMVSASDSFGGLMLQSPLANDLDQREIFYLYLFPGNDRNRKAFTRNIVYLVDISGSMQGRPLESVKHALFSALFDLSPEDSFNIIAFNGSMSIFSSSLELATIEVVEKAIQWISVNFVAGGGTNILSPLTQAMEMLPISSDSVPLIFLITDGAVEDERQICDVVNGHLTNRGTMSPRISTFGIGTYCNHYFLKMLSMIGRGWCDAAYELDSIEARLQRLFISAGSIKVANITIDTLEHLHELEVYPSSIPDLLSGIPLVVSGRYKGNFPETLKAKGVFRDKSSFIMDLMVQKAKSIPLDKVVARQQIELLTAQAWHSESKQLEHKVAQMSLQSGFPSEYTRFLLLQTNRGTQGSDSLGLQRVFSKINLQKVVESKEQRMIVLRSLGVGFGNVTATAENTAPGFEEPKLSDQAGGALVKAASRLIDCWCCACFIRTCSAMNDQCAIALTQLCSALSCFGCFSLCAELCCDF